MGRKRTACLICASIKALCSRERPSCSRCRRLSLACKYSGTADASSRVAEEPPRHQLQLTRGRSRVGCANCRRRKKKCDERQPTCGDCARLGLQCVPRTRTIPQPCGAGSDIASRSHVPTRSETELRGTSEKWTAAAADTHNTAGNVSEGGGSEGGGSPPVSPFADWIALIDDEDEAMASLRRPENLAGSVALVDLPVPCPREDEVGYATFLPPTALNNLTGVTLAVLRTWSIGERHLLNHFLQSVSRALVLADEDEHNPFLRVVVPMALESEMVRHALVALSACHLSRVYPAFEDTVFVHRSVALQALKVTLSDDEEDRWEVEWTLATTLLLCLTEICEGTSRKWFLHLHGARALLLNLEPENIESRGESFRFLVELFNYLCRIASVACNGLPPVVEGCPEVPRPAGIHQLTGMAGWLYEVLPSISNLTEQCRALPPSEVPEELCAQALELEMKLQSWTPGDAQLPGRHATEARAAAFATRWAILMRLNQVTRRLENDDAQITKAADNILSALSLIRPGSETEARILFPLFMAGVGSMTKANRLTVEYRLSIMETTIGFGNIAVAHRLLQELWRRANDGQVMDWQVLQRTKYPGLVLL